MVYGLYTALGVAALVLIVATLISVARNSDISIVGKIVWAIVTVCFPFFGSRATDVQPPSQCWASREPCGDMDTPPGRASWSSTR